MNILKLFIPFWSLVTAKIYLVESDNQNKYLIETEGIL